VFIFDFYLIPWPLLQVEKGKAYEIISRCRITPSPFGEGWGEVLTAKS